MDYVRQEPTVLAPEQLHSHALVRLDTLVQVVAALVLQMQQQLQRVLNASLELILQQAPLPLVPIAPLERTDQPLVYKQLLAQEH